MKTSADLVRDVPPVVVYNKGGRDFRLERLGRGEPTPREFFYGFLDLELAGISATMFSSAGPVPGLQGAAADVIERLFARGTKFSLRPFSARLRAPEISGAKVVISYTDGFSLSLGIGYGRRAERPILIGGFHSLSDLEDRAMAWARPMVRALIRRSLAGLDHVFCFGATDRTVAIARYGLSPDRSSVVPFGIDTEFWRPVATERPADFVLAVGQDPNRDYDLLAAAPGEHPTRIVTRQLVRIPQGAAHVKTSVGDFFGSDSMTDDELRRLYNMACAVVVPLKDVNQPSGYSVSLQAMSCGRPLIITRNCGLWSDVLRDGEDCLLVPPGDAAALGAAINRVRSDPGLAARLGRAARETVLKYFRLEKNGEGAVALVRLGFRLAAEREAAALHAHDA